MVFVSLDNLCAVKYRDWGVTKPPRPKGTITNKKKYLLFPWSPGLHFLKSTVFFSLAWNINKILGKSVTFPSKYFKSVCQRILHCGPYNPFCLFISPSSEKGQKQNACDDIRRAREHKRPRRARIMWRRFSRPHHTADGFRGTAQGRAPCSCIALWVSELCPAKPPAAGYRNHRRTWWEQEDLFVHSHFFFSF